MVKSRKTRQKTDSRPTRRMVAQQAGVSDATVTHALLNTPGKRISRETRERVRKIATELGYKPNFVGRALQTGKTFTVGILQPSYGSIFSVYYQTMIFGMVKAMQHDDYHLLVLFRSEEESFRKVIEQGRVDGMFILQSDRGVGYIEEVAKTGIPAVVVNSHYDKWDIAKLGCAHSDHYLLMKEVLAEFRSLGCKSVVQIHDHRLCDVNFHMFNAFQEAAEKLAEEGVVASSLIPDNARFKQQMENAFAAGQKWDGVFIDGPWLAEGFVTAGKKHGLEPGRDYQLITSSTIDGETTPSRSEISAYTHQPEQVGAAAWDVMRELIGGGTEQPLRLVPYKRYDGRAKD
jgi:DNA-binding LacI/PurR family transcriptional regulator